ncbi:MAG: hypothetical protein LBU08_01435 [Tannerellaceae bacterium]|jgi:hypothetical protein|nr:hypothetical protein [Tannerellaceae bacterium]
MYYKLPLLLLLLPLFFSCEKQQAPESNFFVHYIRLTDPAQPAPLSRAARGATVALVGQGLDNIVAVAFNDLEAVLNPVFVTPTTLIVTIPDAIPDDISHTVRLRTANGLFFLYSHFIVELPLPVITSISDPQAADSAELTLHGAHFYTTSQGPPTVTFTPLPPSADEPTDEPATPPLPAQVLSAQRNQLTVRVPIGAQQGFISVTTDYGSSSPFFFRPDTIPSDTIPTIPSDTIPNP